MKYFGSLLRYSQWVVDGRPETYKTVTVGRPTGCCGAVVSKEGVNKNTLFTSHEFNNNDRPMQREGGLYLPCLGITISKSKGDLTDIPWVKETHIERKPGEGFYIYSAKEIPDRQYPTEGVTIVPGGGWDTQLYDNHIGAIFIAQMYSGYFIGSGGRGVLESFNSLESNSYLFFILTNSQLADWELARGYVQPYICASESGIYNLQYKDPTPKLNWFLLYKE